MKQYGVDHKALTNKGANALHIACHYARLEIMDLLREWGVPVHAVDDAGYNLIHTAAKYGHVDVLKVLKSHKYNVDIHALTDDGSNAIHLASRYGHPEALQLLQRWDVDFTHERRPPTPEPSEPDEPAALQSPSKSMKGKLRGAIFLGRR